MSQPKKHRSRTNIGESYRKRAARVHCQVIASVNVQSYCEGQQVCGRTCTESSQVPSCLPASHACRSCFRVILAAQLSPVPEQQLFAHCDLANLLRSSYATL